MVAAGAFRADLYYRLNVLPIRLPPLRERLDDLEALVETLAEDISRRSGLPHKSLNADALELLARHDWPGNIRELRNALEQATLMTDDLSLGARHFGALSATVAPAREALLERPAAVPPMAPRIEATEPQAWVPLPQAVAEMEARAIRQALAHTGGNKLAAARRLGISRATLYQKLAVLDAAAPHNAPTNHQGD
jgi:DNA-binding NtrC family response regulator